jgi:hypothetical protein
MLAAAERKLFPHGVNPADDAEKLVGEADHVDDLPRFGPGVAGASGRQCMPSDLSENSSSKLAPPLNRIRIFCD